MSMPDPALLALACCEYLGREPQDEAERGRVETEILLKLARSNPQVILQKRRGT